MNISVVVCTYNRSACLKPMLQSLRESVIPAQVSWELILVDNNSDDDTRLVFEEFETRNNLKAKYVLEKQPGVAHARNRGVKEAEGDIVAFTDDDVLVDPHWLQHIAKVFQEHNGVAGVGGKILPIWEASKPRWLEPALYHIIALLDYGDAVAYMDSPDLWGANFAVRSTMFKKYGLFDSNLGRVPQKLYVGEETEFLQRLLNGGEKLLYAPWPVIYHRVPAHRLSKQYFRRWRYDEGQMKGLLRHQAKYFHFFNLQTLGPKNLARDLVVSTLKIGCFARDRFHHELKISYLLGFISGRVKQMRGRSPSMLKGPVSVDVELTNRCNLQCPMCWFHGQSGVGDRYRDSELKTEQVLDLIDQLAASKPHLYFGGAEPFFRRDFLAILAHAKRRGLSVSFTTNGTLLNQATTETLVELAVDDLNVSLDGPEEVHDQRRGRGTFRKVLANLQRLLECKKRKRRKSPRITINITLNPFVVGRLQETIDTIKEATSNEVDFFRIHHLWFVTPGELRAHQAEVQQALGSLAPGAQSHCIPLSQLPAPGVLAEEIAQLKSANKVVFFPDIHGQEIHDFYADGYRSTRRCLAPFQSVLVKPNGDVKFCPDEWLDDYVLGNVRQERFDVIWNSDKANHFRSVIFQKRTFPACKRCSWLYSC